MGFLRTGWEHARLCTEISELLAGANPEVSPLAVYGKLADLSAFRAEREMEYFANLTFTSLIESRSWVIPERYQREALRPASDEVMATDGTPIMSTRGGHQFVALLEAGESFRATLRCHRAGANPASCNWHVIGPDDGLIAHGSVAPGEEYEKLLDDLEKELLELTDSRRGEKAVSLVMRPGRYCHRRMFDGAEEDAGLACRRGRDASCCCRRAPASATRRK